MDYADFLAGKRAVAQPAGIVPMPMSPALYPYQVDIVDRALRIGRYATFADCGLGKTLMQLEWARQISTRGHVLIVAPLAVASQTAAESEAFGYGELPYSRDGSMPALVTITNYEHIDKFDLDRLAGIVLDESSILKNHTGKMRQRLTDAAQSIPYRLCCSATPAPNDHMELGTHSEFLGVMTRAEMLAMYFVHDGGETQKWRIKGHAVGDFWAWVCTWASMIRRPSDYGYPDDGFVLPRLDELTHTVQSVTQQGQLFAVVTDLASRRAARSASLDARVEKAAALANGNTREQWLIWCNYNDESSALTKAIPGAVEIKGSDSIEHKSATMTGFAAGLVRVIVTKPSIAGFGMNWQNCNRMIFCGLSDSYEQYYQAIRRCWRYGQKRPVEAHIVMDEASMPVLRNIQRKQADADAMSDGMVEASRTAHGLEIKRSEYMTDVTKEGAWEMRLGDCVEQLATVSDGSVGFSVFSPPFASLYTYSDSDRDMGNCQDSDTFMRHFSFLTHELFRVVAPGRLVSMHCMNLPTSKARDGVIGIRDFRGDLIRAMESAGWVYHSEVVIWKDPVTAMQRTKALGLLHKQIRKDSAMSRQGIPDYLCTFRKPGDNADPLSHTAEEFPVHLWQQYASPVWMDINPSRTLQFRSAREDKDERHICPLQLDVIERAIDLWSKPGDLVLSPFAGIGSEGFVALEKGRRFIGVELKRSYYETACRNLREASFATRTQLQMFGG